MSDFQDVKDRVNLVEYIRPYVSQIERHSQLYKVKCIFHTENSASLTLYPDGSFYCFGCHKSGDVFDVSMHVHNLTKGEALKEVARYAGVILTPLSAEHRAKETRRERLYALIQDAATLYQQWLYLESSEHALTYLTKRGLSLSTIRFAQLGFTGNGARNTLCSGNLIHMDYTDQEMIDAGLAYRNDQGQMCDTFYNRIMIPITDHKGRIVGFSGRDMGEKGPKYKNTGSTEIFKKGSLIYTPNSRVKNAHHEAQDACVVVEGHMDAISALNRGFGNIVSQMGTSFTDDQLTLLCKGINKLIFCLDNDAAGQTALVELVTKHLHRAADLGVDLYVMTAPHGKDPDDTFREHPELWQPAVDAARPVVDLLIERELAKVSNPTTAQKITMARALMPLLKGTNALVSEDSVSKLAAALGYKVETLEAWLQTEVSVMAPSKTPVQTAAPRLTILETTVLHGILAHDADNQRWIDRANAVLARYGEYPYALAPLNCDDFSTRTARDLMTFVLEGIRQGERPIAYYVSEKVGTSGPLSETFERAYQKAAIDTIVNVSAQSPAPLDYYGFLRAVIMLRRVHLEADIRRPDLPRDLLMECLQANRILGQAAL